MKSRPLLPALVLLAALSAAALPAGAHNEGIPSVPVSIKNMTHLQNIPNLSGNTMDFFERKLPDGTIKRYLVAANVGNGFDIVEITDPAHPATVGRYLLPDNNPANAAQSSAGANVHAWVSVNARRNIVVLTVEEQPAPGSRTVRHNGASGLQLVDISDVTNPRSLGKIDGLDGPHTVRMIGDNHAYTSLNTWVVDYTNPMSPTASKKAVEGHEFYEDPNIPGRMYVGMASTAVGRWGVFDIANPGNPVLLDDTPDNKIVSAHEVYPSPDSRYVGVSDFTTGQNDVTCPGGGVHFYDIAGGNVFSPSKLGQWYAPYSGASPDRTVNAPNNASCTLHSWQHQPERSLALAGLYSGGTWVFDPSKATQAGGLYAEYAGVRGTTTWGNTLANVRDAADYVNAAQWLPFDLADPAQERLVFTNGSARGLDIYSYTGPLPKKLSRVNVQPTAPAGIVSGTLERYAVLTHAGWRNLPLAGKTVEVTAGGTTVTATTAADGSFSAQLPLAQGANTVTARWAGDDRFEISQVTRAVTQ